MRILLPLIAYWLVANSYDHKNRNPYWSYKEQHSWNELYPTCTTGMFQSPIYLTPSQAHFDHRLIRDPLRFDNYLNENVSYGGVLQNNGKYVTWTISNLSVGDVRLMPRLSGSQLNSWFVLHHIALHWGDGTIGDEGLCQRGSDHLIGTDLKTSPVEIQFFHYNTLYESFSEAQSKPDGLAIFSYLLKAPPISGETATPTTPTGSFLVNLTELTSNFGQVSLEGQEKQVYLTLYKLLPFTEWNQSSPAYYRYFGSLTMPPCFESVVWTVFAEPIVAAEKDIRAVMTSFYAKSMQNSGTEPLGNNYRPIQQPKDRIVTTNSRQLARPHKRGSASSINNNFKLLLILSSSTMLLIQFY